MMGQVEMFSCVCHLIKRCENIFEALPSGLIYFSIRFGFVEFAF
jgi:hypothetical protein